MSKSKGNFSPPEVVFDRYGADALRFYLMLSPLMRAEDLNFNEEAIKDVYRKVIMLLENIKQFYELYRKNNAKLNDTSSDHILDRWIISRLQELLKTGTATMEDYDTNKTCSEIMVFIDELSTWYIRRSRDRFKFENKKEKEKATRTLAYVLHALAKMLAPITPFIAEDIQQMFRKTNKKIEESVHLELWPEYNPALFNKSLNEKMQQVRNIVSRALEEREKAKIPLRQILNRVEITGVSLEKELAQLIVDEVNVKHLEMKKGTTFSVALDTKITPELIREGTAREIIRLINSYRKQQNLTINEKIILAIAIDEDLNSFKEEIQQKVGAKILYLKKPGEKLEGYSFSAKEKIKEKTVEIAFRLAKDA